MYEEEEMLEMPEGEEDQENVKDPLIAVHMSQEEAAELDEAQGQEVVDPKTGYKIYSPLAAYMETPGVGEEMKKAFLTAKNVVKENPGMKQMSRMPANYAEGGAVMPEDLGRKGDDSIVLMPLSLAKFFDEVQGKRSINPKTGLREYGFFTEFLRIAAPIVGTIAGSMIGMPHLGIAAMAGLSSMGVNAATGQPWKYALKNGLTNATLAYAAPSAAQGLAKAFPNAASAIGKGASAVLPSSASTALGSYLGTGAGSTIGGMAAAGAGRVLTGAPQPVAQPTTYNANNSMTNLQPAGQVAGQAMQGAAESPGIMSQLGGLLSNPWIMTPAIGGMLAMGKREDDKKAKKASEKAYDRIAQMRRGFEHVPDYSQAGYHSAQELMPVDEGFDPYDNSHEHRYFKQPSNRHYAIGGEVTMPDDDMGMYEDSSGVGGMGFANGGQVRYFSQGNPGKDGPPMRGLGENGSNFGESSGSAGKRPFSEISDPEQEEANKKRRLQEEMDENIALDMTNNPSFEGGPYDDPYFRKQTYEDLLAKKKPDDKPKESPNFKTDRDQRLEQAVRYLMEKDSIPNENEMEGSSSSIDALQKADQYLYSLPEDEYKEALEHLNYLNDLQYLSPEQGGPDLEWTRSNTPQSDEEMSEQEIPEEEMLEEEMPSDDEESLSPEEYEDLYGFMDYGTGASSSGNPPPPPPPGAGAASSSGFARGGQVQYFGKGGAPAHMTLEQFKQIEKGNPQWTPLPYPEWTKKSMDQKARLWAELGPDVAKYAANKYANQATRYLGGKAYDLETQKEADGWDAFHLKLAKEAHELSNAVLKNTNTLYPVASPASAPKPTPSAASSPPKPIVAAPLPKPVAPPPAAKVTAPILPPPPAVKVAAPVVAPAKKNMPFSEYAQLAKTNRFWTPVGTAQNKSDWMEKSLQNPRMWAQLGPEIIPQFLEQARNTKNLTPQQQQLMSVLRNSHDELYKPKSAPIAPPPKPAPLPVPPPVLAAPKPPVIAPAPLPAAPPPAPAPLPAIKPAPLPAPPSAPLPPAPPVMAPSAPVPVAEQLHNSHRVPGAEMMNPDYARQLQAPGSYFIGKDLYAQKNPPPRESIDRNVHGPILRNLPQGARAPTVQERYPSYFLSNLYSDLYGQAPQRYAQGGPITGPGGGQDDLIQSHVPQNAYIVDATTVSRLGDGSTNQGFKYLDMLKQNADAYPVMPEMDGQHYAHGGMHAQNAIPAMLSDGEYQLDPQTVSKIGDGSNKQGVKILDQFRKNIREYGAKNGSGMPSKMKPYFHYLPKSNFKMQFEQRR